MKTARKPKQGMFYLIEFQDELKPYYSHLCKYGVTTNPKNRFKTHKSNTGDFEILESFFVRDMFYFEGKLKSHGCGILIGGESGIFSDENDPDREEGYYTIQELRTAIKETKNKYQYEEYKK